VTTTNEDHTKHRRYDVRNFMKWLKKQIKNGLRVIQWEHGESKISEKGLARLERAECSKGWVDGPRWRLRSESRHT